MLATVLWTVCFPQSLEVEFVVRRAAWLVSPRTNRPVLLATLLMANTTYGSFLWPTLLMACSSEQRMSIGLSVYIIRHVLCIPLCTLLITFYAPFITLHALCTTLHAPIYNALGILLALYTPVTSSFHAPLVPRVP